MSDDEFFINQLIKSDLKCIISIESEETMYRIFCESYENFIKSIDRKSKKYNVSEKEELEEQTKLVNSFLKLAYWY